MRETNKTEKKKTVVKDKIDPENFKGAKVMSDYPGRSSLIYRREGKC